LQITDPQKVFEKIVIFNSIEIFHIYSKQCFDLWISWCNIDSRPTQQLLNRCQKTLFLLNCLFVSGFFVQEATGKHYILKEQYFIYKIKYFVVKSMLILMFKK